MERIDLRSDTVTLPSPSMREAMQRADLGDDGYGEDPTVNKLQEMAAERVGKQAALLMPSGCMANLVSLLTHCGRQGEVILGYSTDMYIWECGAMSAVGGIHPMPLANLADGTLDLEEVKAAVRDNDVHFPRTQLICIENSNNICGGIPLTPKYMKDLRAVADGRHLPVHLDGARLFNASVALGVDVRQITKHAHSLMFCLSKGLCCPVGSIVCGDSAFIAEARRQRKLLGGQMRQAGVLAAAGLEALTHMVDRLAEDHYHAALLADGLRGIKKLTLKPAVVQTNILYFQCTDNRFSQQVLIDKLASQGLLVLPMGEWTRAVTHYGIEKHHVDRAISIISKVIGHD